MTDVRLVLTSPTHGVYIVNDLYELRVMQDCVEVRAIDVDDGTSEQYAEVDRLDQALELILQDYTDGLPGKNVPCG